MNGIPSFYGIHRRYTIYRNEPWDQKQKERDAEEGNGIGNTKQAKLLNTKQPATRQSYSTACEAVHFHLVRTTKQQNGPKMHCLRGIYSAELLYYLDLVCTALNSHAHTGSGLTAIPFAFAFWIGVSDVVKTPESGSYSVLDYKVNNPRPDLGSLCSQFASQLNPCSIHCGRTPHGSAGNRKQASSWSRGIACDEAAKGRPDAARIWFRGK